MKCDFFVDMIFIAFVSLKLNSGRQNAAFCCVIVEIYGISLLLVVYNVQPII